MLHDHVSDCTFTRCKHSDCFPLLCPKNILRGVISDVLWCSCYALVIISNRWNQYVFSILHRLYIWGHRWILALLLIFVDWYKHSKTNFASSKCILNRIWCIIWRPKIDFWSKCPHYIMDYIKNLGSNLLLVSLVWNLAYIDYSLCQIWSVYMPYLQCCDHSKKCVFLVVQQAEVLLNFFWWVYTHP